MKSFTEWESDTADVVFPQGGSSVHQGGLLEGDEDRAHAGDVFGLLAGLGVKVTQPGHPFPLSAWGRLVYVVYKGFFCCPGSNNKVCRFNGEALVSYLAAALLQK